MDCLDIDGPERYKSGCVYASCPTCVIPAGPKHFMEPLKPERFRRAEEIIRFHREDDGESKNKTLIKWKENAFQQNRTLSLRRMYYMESFRLILLLEDPHMYTPCILFP